MKKFSAITLCLALVGCVTIAGENLLVVKGSISNELLAKGCQVELRRGVKANTLDFDIRSIYSSSFIADYLVDPNGGMHKVLLVCNGEVVRHKEVFVSSAKTEVDIYP